ncbi:MAG TPA: PAS domain S-box protein [Geobacteraceae bacterium]
MEERELERLCRRIVEASGDAFLFADCRGVIRLWNGGAAAVFGHSAEEALGQTLDLIVPERLRERHWDGFDRVMATGVTRYGHEVLAVPAQRKDGARISVEFTVALIRDEAGAIAGVAAVLRDVTARWLKEKELEARLARWRKGSAGGELTIE